MSDDRTTRVGFIGLGTMGAFMAANLQAAGRSLVVNDLEPAKADLLLEGGARWADDPATVAKSCAVVFISLPGPVEVEGLVFGSGGLIKVMQASDVLIDLSTNAPSTARAIHAALADKGAHFLDAPVSGGPAGAKSGELSILVGGEAEIFERCRAYLDSIGDEIMYIGPCGAGLVAKLAHNAASYGINAILAEIFTLGVKGGVKPLALWNALRKGAMGRRRTFDGLAAQFLPDIYDPPSFALRLARKDVSLAVALGRETKVPMRLINLVLEEMAEAGNRGWDASDSRVFMKLQKERAGVAISESREAIRELLAADNTGK